MVNENTDILWYRQPANEWIEALPIGNGRLGAMVFGGAPDERIQFNEDTLWIGEPHDYAHPGAAQYLPELRRLLYEGKQAEAEQLAMDHCMSVPLRQVPYQPFGDLLLTFGGHAAPAEYRRQLDLDRALATTEYRANGIHFRREAFASFPHQVIVVRLFADQAGALSFTGRLATPHKEGRTVRRDAVTLALHGVMPAGFAPNQAHYDHPLRYEAQVCVWTEGGRVEVTDGGFTVEKADTVTLLLAAATSFVDYRTVDGDPQTRCAAALAAVEGIAGDALLAAHLADYQPRYRRVTLDLGRTAAAEQPTDERISGFAAGQDPQLDALFFQYGRYLLLASSRPGSQPANLQGIWNDLLEPPWDSKWTVNINTEMNYWPAESCNLTDCAEPLFAMLEDLAQTGQSVAREHYGARGWVLHHNTDLWRGAAPINASNHGIWPTGGAWLCQHLWWHYEFTGDRQFLAERAYPILRGASLFFTDYLVEDPRTGRLISGPSNSPENGGLVMGPTMDHQIIRALFNAAIAASTILEIDADLRGQWIEKRDLLAPNQVGRLGQLQEWLEDVDDPENKHRHVSHLWGLFPGEELIPRVDAKLARAAQTSLEMRGDGGTGWSKAWKINLWARLLDGDHALRMMHEMLKASVAPNLFDLHPPFQIDGNFGATSGIAQMLLQSPADEVALLPALPAAWPTGHVQGLCARGGVEVDLRWTEGRIEPARLRARLDRPIRLRPPLGWRVESVAVSSAMPVALLKAEDGTARFEVHAGESYQVTFTGA